MKRVFTDKLNQIVITPAIGIVWNQRGILISFAWLNAACSVLVFSRQK